MNENDEQYYFIDGALSLVDENMPDGAYMQACIDSIEFIWPNHFGTKVDGYSKYIEYLKEKTRLHENAKLTNNDMEVTK